MRISTKGRYGVRAMFDLAMHNRQTAVPLKTVAQREHISEKYLEHLFASLKKAGLIHSVRGAQGGYRLAHAPEDITLGDIIRILEGPVTPSECVSEGCEADNCERAADCVMHEVWGRVRNEINAVLDSITLADICEEQRKMQKSGYMFHI